MVALSARRGWADPLDASLFTANIDRPTLEALLAAARAAFPDLRRYLRLKAEALGQERLPWWDLFAPIGRSRRRWDWPDATAFVADQFGSFSGRMRGLAERAVAERWIDAGPRPGKVGGSFCTWLIGDQSRVLMNFSPTYDAVSTLAHELGHAYHNLNEAGLTPLQRETPMTLAETASTFCETIVREAALRDADEAEQLFIVEQSLQGACQIVVDIVSRFDFERAVFAVRPERELSIGDFNRLMRDAQLGTYGDALDPDHLHPYMWAVKGHYYIPGFSFYNYPYLFGLLFGLGLYARYRVDPARFVANYDQLLAATGQADAADLAARFGIDIRSP
ncbi:MAG TPA: M3 family metallopeptidase, partial [Thermomicrobiales bacterium]|nr:M3 family metallopeptidase [Thermomicrobiales bacterium]